ncbi:MAG: D-alanyl-D-alanine carboxypeptidase/D-alanyl-D-alanine-endopeptidase [Bacteroidetes bacterium]|nr:D-alanyl-D-alanine carboxypeptidase/D-alanyl-D-alanine-endopeptidase [Bacteroidota bacterium]
MPLFDRCLAAVEIADAASGTVLYARNEHLLLRPASNVKLFTTAAAVLGMPQDFHFETTIAVAGTRRHTLYCIGGGDPLFSSQDIQKLAQFVHAANIERIDTLVMDGSLYNADIYGQGWMWDDEADPFTPYLSAFPVDGNVVRINVRKTSQQASSIIVSSRPSSRFFQITQADAADAGRHGSGFHMEKVPRSNEILLFGTPRSGRTESKQFSIWRPIDVFADLLQTELQRRGITADTLVVTSASSKPSELQPLGSIRRPLSPVLAEMNKKSNNLSAEAMLRALSFGTGRSISQVSASDGLAAMSVILKIHRMDERDMALYDGSGISFYNLATAASLGRLLRMLAANEAYERFRASLAIGGVDGTLRNRMRDLAASRGFRGKTGTVRGVSALSGYVQAPGGHLLTVVMLMQNFKGRHTPYRAVQDRIVRHCFNYSATKTPTTQTR